MNIIGVILGGGAGSRLQPLTTLRSKPAVPLAGKFRLVDVPISNCINSRIFKIYLLTQFNSSSLHHHIHSSYQFDSFSNGFVRVLAAEQTPESKDWFQGTADAVRQSIHHLDDGEPDLVVILSGDQLFRMDFRDVIRHHIDYKSDITVCTTPVGRAEATRFGILQMSADHRITKYVEKPADEQLTEDLRAPVGEEQYLASMGIYVFNYQTIKSVLANNNGTDFGHDIIPETIHSYRTHGYVFRDYWQDIGTIRAFWEENLALTDPVPKFTFHDSAAPIYTRARFLPPSNIHDCHFRNCLLTEGLDISAASITRSVIGLRAAIRKGTSISESIIMGNDFYEEEHQSDLPRLGIGENCRIEKAIIDKNVRIGNNVTISPHGLDDIVTKQYSVRDGIIVIPKGVILPDSTTIGGL